MRRLLCVLIGLAFVAGCAGNGSGGSGPALVPTTAPSTSAPSPGHSASPSPSTSPTSGPASPTPQPTAASVPGFSGSTIGTNVSPVQVNGTTAFAIADTCGNLGPTQYGETSGCTADTSSGGQGQSLGTDLQCDATMSNNYHIHFFLGIYVNGQWIILPEALGIVGTANPPPSEIVYLNTNGCFYYLHTHDSTGVVHVEDPNPNGTLITQPIHMLGDLFNEWGITVNSLEFGPYNGLVTVYTSGQTYRGGNDCSGTYAPPGAASSSPIVPESDLTLWQGDPNTIPLYSHEVIWFYVGAGNPTALPNVNFYEEC